MDADDDDDESIVSTLCPGHTIMSRMTQNSASDHNFKVKEVEKVKFYILNEFFIHKLKQTYIDFILCVLKQKCGNCN